MFKTETHLHVSEVSRCSHLTAAEMMEYYHKAGFSTVFVTDHLNPAYYEDHGETPEERADWFMSGFENAKKAGYALGINVIFATEMHLRGTHNHYLLYNVPRDFLLIAPTLFDKTPADLYAKAKEYGITVVQAHPFRDGNCTPTPECADALEVINPNPRHENFDDKAIEIAKKHSLPMTSGSDAHRPEDIGNGGVITEKEIKTTNDYLDALFGGKLTLMGGKEQ